MIKIVTDSTSYLPTELIRKYDLSIVSLNVTLNNQTKRELDIANETFYDEMNDAAEIPTSSQPSPDELYTIFESIVSAGDAVLGIFISSQMSGLFSSSHLVRDMILEKYPNADIQLFDSGTNCMQLGFIALEAAKFALEGHSMADTIKRAEYVKAHSRFLFTPDTLTYLKKGGRIGSASALLGTLLQIKPILTVEQGVTSVFAKVRTKKKAVDTLISGLMEDLKSASLENIIVHHINCPEEGQQLADRLSNLLDQKVAIQSIGPVIGLHVGPGSIGIAYTTK